MTFQITSPSGATQVGYSRRDALYAAGVLAEKERRLTSRKAVPVAVYQNDKHIADVWADAMQEIG